MTSDKDGTLYWAATGGESTEVVPSGGTNDGNNLWAVSGVFTAAELARLGTLLAEREAAVDGRSLVAQDWATRQHAAGTLLDADPWSDNE